MFLALSLPLDLFQVQVFVLQRGQGLVFADQSGGAHLGAALSDSEGYRLHNVIGNERLFASVITTNGSPGPAYGANIRMLAFKPLPDSRNSVYFQGVRDNELDH